MAQELFPLGQVVATEGIGTLMENGIDVMQYLARHQRGDWGDLDEADNISNNQALKNDWRLLSNYEVTDGTNIWIVTEYDRSVTTLLLPSEY